MKATFESGKDPKNVIPFPKMMKTKDGLVVAFIRPRNGYVAYVGLTNWSLFGHSDCWEMACFTDMEPGDRLTFEF